MTYDNWKCTDPADAQDDSLPCRYFSTGECMVCGAKDGELCVVEHERWRAAKARKGEWKRYGY